MQNEKYLKFRETYPSFIYKAYHIDREENSVLLTFDFEIEGLCEFHPATRIRTDNLNVLNEANSETAERIVFNLGMVELISYWKAACPKKVKVECGNMSDRDIKWWKKLYFRGLSEFFYINKIDTDEEKFMEIEVNKDLHDHIHPEQFNCADLNLITVGGGKDSCVTTALLKNFKEKNMFFTVNDQQARTDTVLAGGYDESRIVKTYRTIDENLLNLNAKGFLNGHTPFSAIVAFLSLYCAYLIGARFIVLSNESSADETNLIGAEVNHQYSKSYEFECDFTAYVNRTIFDTIEYFSLLRPFSELQIAKMFSHFTEFHDTFRSCNRGSKKNVWCAKCAKCLFVFSILAPFMDYERLCEIFGNDILNDADLIADFEGLAGITELKPFECVGTRSEFNFAVNALIKKFEAEGRELPLLCKLYKEKVKNPQIDENLLKDYNALNNVPEEFVEAIMEMYNYVAQDN